MENTIDTATAILQTAQRITQAVGYNGLSFRDVASAIGIKSASVHYHFPTKAMLAAAVAQRYTDTLLARLREVDALGLDPNEALKAYIAGVRWTLEQDGRMCLCGMLAAETDAIPPEVRAEVRRFVDVNVHWLSSTIERAMNKKAGGSRSGSMPASEPGDAARDHARALFAALEGAMLIARGTGDLASFDAMTREFDRLGLSRC